MTTRRGFLAATLAACTAPAAIRAGVLMPVRPIWTPPRGLPFHTSSGRGLLLPGMWIMMNGVKYVVTDFHISRKQPHVARVNCESLDTYTVEERLGHEEGAFHTRIAGARLIGSFSVDLDTFPFEDSSC